MLFKIKMIVSVFCLFSVVLSSTVFAEKAPVFSLPGVKSTIDLKAYRGKVVYLDFWASWCEPCRKSFDWMNEIQTEYKGKGLTVIAINLDESRRDAIKFLKSHPPRFTVAFDSKGKSAESYNVESMPSSFLIDQKGNLVSSHAGFRSKDKAVLENEIKALLKKKT